MKQVASVIIVNYKKEILLAERLAKEGFGLYCLPGGKEDDDDRDLSDTAYREVFEEVNLQLDNLEYLGSHTIKLDNEWRLNIYCTVVSDDSDLMNVEEDKNSDVKWFKLKSLPENIFPHNKDIIEIYMEEVIDKIDDIKLENSLMDRMKKYHTR